MIDIDKCIGLVNLEHCFTFQLKIMLTFDLLILSINLKETDQIELIFSIQADVYYVNEYKLEKQEDMKEEYRRVG